MGTSLQKSNYEFRSSFGYVNLLDLRMKNVKQKKYSEMAEPVCWLIKNVRVNVRELLKSKLEVVQ